LATKASEQQSVRDLLRAVPENELFALASVDPDATLGVKKKAAARELATIGAELGDLQARLHAEGSRSLLVVLQALDTGGKDGTIKHAMSGLNPQGVRVTGFKAPTKTELSHHFLWRIRRALPEPGEIMIFNRSHYEDVVVPMVRHTLPDRAIARRYQEINEFERRLLESGTHTVKLFLHISYDEQRARLLRRLRDPARRWKFAANDIKERGHWDEYQAAYDAAITASSTEVAPWYVVPANHKWFRNWAVSHILTEVLREMQPKFPKPQLNIGKLVKQLEPDPKGFETKRRRRSTADHGAGA
jgi:PPK2 family polyphosphate:nucleotide phosphotransferase